MSRPLRIEFPGAHYHVTTRGNGRADIYRDDADREAFSDILGGAVERFGWLCHAYCLMGNHYHLLVETPQPNLGRGMRHLNGVYTQRFNRRHERTGHVFQGRYHAVLVDRDSHFLELARYVVLNPVRAGLARRVEDWRWSSYRATQDLDAAPAWLHTKFLLGQFGARRLAARRNYATFVAAGADGDNPWEDLKGQIYLGGDDFVRAMRARAGNAVPAEIPQDQRRPVPKPLEAFSAQMEDRDEAMVLAYASGAYSLSAIARHFGVHYSTVSRAVKRREARNAG